MCLLTCVSLGREPDGVPVFGFQAGYPGPSPGPARLSCGGQQIVVRNVVLRMAWTLTSQGLEPQSIRNEQTRRTVPLSGEVFQIVLTNGQRYTASTLVPVGKPRVSELAPDPRAARLAARIRGRQVELPLRSADGRLQVVWRTLVHDGANYVRQEIEVTAAREACVIQEVVWLDTKVPGARTLGQVDGSPVVADDFFLGSEDPQALNRTSASRTLAGDERSVSCRLRREAPLRRGDTFKASFVIGVAPPGQMRRAFLYYLERERAHPFRPFLHYNSWYDIAWNPFALNETNCLEAIRITGDRFIETHRIAMDAMVFDDGWDDPKTLWQFHSGFPNGFTPLAELCRRYHTRLGVWLSPFGGYGEPRNLRLKFGHAQGYETNATGFSLAGPSTTPRSSSRV